LTDKDIEETIVGLNAGPGIPAMGISSPHRVDRNRDVNVIRPTASHDDTAHHQTAPGCRN